jgi:hypothetical protein
LEKKKVELKANGEKKNGELKKKGNPKEKKNGFAKKENPNEKKNGLKKNGGATTVGKKAGLVKKIDSSSKASALVWEKATKNRNKTIKIKLINLLFFLRISTPLK